MDIFVHFFGTNNITLPIFQHLKFVDYSLVHSTFKGVKATQDGLVQSQLRQGALGQNG